MRTTIAREKRIKQMSEKGYLSLTPSERAERIKKGLDYLKVMAHTLEEESCQRLVKKGAVQESYE